MYLKGWRWVSFFVLLFIFSLFPPLAWSEVPLPIEGKGSVAGNSGTFTYSIPIEVPPGRNGLAPQLALSYNSSGGNGFLGVGWDLPIGYVMRSTKDGVNYYCVPSAANSCFVFMLGGISSELIPRTDWCSDCYGAKIEGGFIQFRFINNTYWQAIDKAGIKHIFGETSASRVVVSATNTFKWAIDKTVDTHGNMVTYTYFQNQGEIYIDKIDYQTNHIVFKRDNSRTDRPTLFGLGPVVTTAYRLSEIEVYTNWNGTTGTLYKKMALGYCGTTGVACAASSTGRSVLGKVTQYGSDGVTALPATILTPQNVAAEWTTSTWTGPSPGVIDEQCFSGDLNGDAKTDFWCETASGSGTWDVRLSTGTGWTSQTWSGPALTFPINDRCFTGNLDGDSRIDFWCETASGSGTWDVRLSTGTGWTPQTWSGPALNFPIGDRCFTGDLDGDGKTDFWCETANNGWWGSWDVRRSTGSGWTTETWLGLGVSFPVHDRCFTGDLNGDGKTDYWCETASGSGVWEVALSLSYGGGWSRTTWTTTSGSNATPAFPVSGQCLTGDLNGDGKTDLWCQGGSTGLWQAWLSTGSGWWTQTWQGSSLTSPANHCLTGDLDANGMTDFWCNAGTNWDVKLSTGSGWIEKTLTGAPIGDPTSWLTKAQMPTPRSAVGVGVINGIIYVVGGRTNGSSYLATLEAYDPAANTWTTKIPMPTVRECAGVGVINGILYAVGGYNSSNGSLSIVEAYDPATNTWTTKTPMPTARSCVGVGVVNGILYAVGGYNNGDLATVQAYDPATNTWATKTPMSIARRGPGVGVIGGTLYAVGGCCVPYLPSSYLEAYDPITDNWTAKALMPTGRMPGVGVVNGLLYAVGGRNSSGSDLATVQAYDPATNTWATKTPMSTARNLVGVGSINGVLYAVGGSSGINTHLGVVEALILNVKGRCLGGDLDGDGKSDFWCYQSGGNWGVNLMNPGISDLLVGVSNGIGGNTTVTYKPSSSDWTSTDSGWNLPFVTQNVASLTTCDNYNGTNCVTGANVSTTNYNYMGAYYNATEREFRNYAYVKSTNAVNNSTTESWFHQGNGTSASPDNGGDSPGYTAGLSYRTIVKDGTGVIRSQQETLYTADSDGVAPYFTPVQQEDSWFCDAPGACKQTRSILTFDHTNGNLTREDQYGDLSVTTDDRTATKSYSPNTAAWILGLPTSEIVYQGIGTATQVARTDFYYDQVTDCNTASTNQTPTKGDLTRTVRWLSGGISPETRMAYDGYGNLICTRDANGNTTTFAYDASSTFQKVVTNALGHQAMTQYYGVDGVATDTGLYGQVKSITTPNGEVVTTTYDVFGRKSQITYPNTLVKTFNYPCTASTGCTPDATNVFGNVGSQYTKESGGGISSWVYFDGLGRTITEKTTGPGTSIVRVDTDYNNLGQLFHKTLPYFDGGANNGSVTYSYDEIGRTKQMTNADTSRTLLCYSLWATTTIDAGNHMRREAKDAYGRLLQVDEYTGTHSACPTNYPAAYATTTYQYDVLGNLRFVTDAKANQTEMRYDTLGRKVFMHDPDMGNWIYAYDNVGNLITQTDARGGVIRFTYDALNRVKTKTAAASSPPTAPSNLTAALSGAQVNLTWTTSISSVGVDHYEIWRSLNNGAYTFISNATDANFIDSGVSSGNIYHYRVRAVDTAMNGSSYSNVDYITVFTDHPLVVGVTSIKAQHLTELRQAVDAVRAAAGLGAAVWTDAPLSGIFIKAVHIQELRDHLAPALAALGLTAPSYTDPTLTAGTTFVKKAHIEDLRQAVQ